MRGWLARTAVLVTVLGATLTQTSVAQAAFSDVPTSYWDYTAITYVAQTKDWMRDYGTSTFKPSTLELRQYVARALVKAFAPTEPIDTSIVIPDLPSSDPYYKYANVAIKLGWMPLWTSGNWAPTTVVKSDAVDKATILALSKKYPSLTSAISGLRAIHPSGGSAYTVDANFPYFQLAHWFGFHYNHDDESMERMPKTQVRRDLMAYELWKAATMSSTTASGASIFNTIALGSSNGSAQQVAQQKVMAYGLLQVGIPYIWGGEWNAKTPTGYCCGAQSYGGMDCSGFVWWTEKKNESGYNAAQFHSSYAAWSIPQRTSSTMAQSTSSKIAWGSLQVGDLMFFAGNGGSSYTDVDHVGIYAGNGWMIHSSGSNDGVALSKVTSGYFYDTFVWGRRIIPTSGLAPERPGRPTSPMGGDGPHEGDGGAPH